MSNEEKPVVGWYKSVRDLLGVDKGEPQSLERKLLLELAKEIVVLRGAEVPRPVEAEEPFEEEGKAAYRAAFGDDRPWLNTPESLRRAWRAAAKAAIETHQKETSMHETVLEAAERVAKETSK